MATSPTPDPNAGDVTGSPTGAQQTPAPRRRGRPRDPATDAKIIDAAAELLRARGFERMTVDDVAAAAGVGKATVYRRWPSKEDLAVAAMERLYSVEFPEPDTGSIWSDLEFAVGGLVAFVNTPEGEAHLRMSITESVRDPRIAALYRRATERGEAQAVRMYQRAVDRGEVRPECNLAFSVQWLTGLVANRLITNRPLPGPDDVPQIVEQLLRGVLAEPAAR